MNRKPNIIDSPTEDRQERENVTTDQSKSYSYQLFDVLTKNKNQDSSHIAAKLAEFFKTKFNAENVIYPTHDQKCYVNFKRENFLIFKESNSNEIKIDNGQIALKIYEYVDLGFVSLNETILRTAN